MTQTQKFLQWYSKDLSHNILQFKVHMELSFSFSTPKIFHRTFCKSHLEIFYYIPTWNCMVPHQTTFFYQKVVWKVQLVQLFSNIRKSWTTLVEQLKSYESCIVWTVIQLKLYNFSWTTKIVWIVWNLWRHQLNLYN